MFDLNQHDRFVVTRRRRLMWSPSLGNVDIYEFALADAGVDPPPFCHVRQRVSRSNVRISFYADEARTEAQKSVQLAPNVSAYLVLARLDLQGNQLSASASEVSKALALEPKNAGALAMKSALEARGQTIP